MVELLVVVAIIGILAAMLMSALTVAKERARRIKCLSNVKQFGLAFISYAIDNNDRLPIRGVSDWPDWMDTSLANRMSRYYGLTRNICYCPSYPEFNNDTYWNNMMNSDNQGGFFLIHILGYCCTIPGAWTIYPSNVNNTLLPDPIFVNNGAPGKYETFGVIVPVISDRVLVADLTPSNTTENDPSRRDSYSFFNVIGEDGVSGIHAAHIDQKHRPAGGNECMLDGSGRWVKFKDMTPRAGDDDSPTFWW